MTVLHVVNLDTIGGVEELFVHYLKSFDSSDSNALLVTGKSIHPQFKKIIEKKTKAVIFEKRCFGMYLPKWLRVPLTSFLLQRIDYKKVVLWNRLESKEKIEKLFPGKEIIYYEHGASWIHKKEQNTSDFFSKIAQIIANSHAAKELLKQKWGISQKITIVENPLRPDVQCTHERTQIRNPYKIGYIGRLIPLKGVFLIVEAISLLKKQGIPCELAIAGDGSDREALIKRINQLGLGKEITMLGPISDVASFYDSIDLLVVPSIREPLGLVALEAQARGCPVVASLVDGLAEAVYDAKSPALIVPTLPCSDYSQFGGEVKKMPDLVYDPLNAVLVPPKLIDPKLLADTIRTVLSDVSQYSQMSRQSIAFCSKRKNFDSYVAELKSLLLS